MAASDPLTWDKVNHFVLGKQHLTLETKGGDLPQIAGDVGGLHATGVTTPYLSLFARVDGFQREQLDRLLYDRPALAKIRCVRNTIYVHPSEVLPFVFCATVRSVTKGSQRFMEARGVSEGQFKALADNIVTLLQERELGAGQIKEELHSELDITPVLQLLVDQGTLVRWRPLAGWRDRRQTYALFADAFPEVDLRAMEEPEAVQRLVRHYLAAFGPVTETDLLWWTGLGKRKVQPALEALGDEITTVAIGEPGGVHLLLRSQWDLLERASIPQRPVVNLLPVLDGYLMGYKERGRYLDEQFRDYVFDRTGNATSTILVSGHVAGVWDVEWGREPWVKYLLFSAVKAGVLAEIQDQARALGRFIFDQEPLLKQCASMTPLTKRTAGSMMSPLKECDAATALEP